MPFEMPTIVENGIPHWIESCADRRCAQDK
jgi:hypothetical protein